MDFFAHQDIARRKTKLLIGYYLLAVALIVITIYLIFVALLGHIIPEGAGVPHSLWIPKVFLWVCICVLAVIGCGTVFKMRQLAEGGESIAHLLGAHRIPSETLEPTERRLLHVVEEMAIASGIPVPSVFVMEEDGINAFAAGYSPSGAVIGVTRGSIQSLNREELQGVIAHEFSHIFNGDMRLNLKLMGVLHGILLIAGIGHILLRSTLYAPRSRTSRNDKGDGGRLALMISGVSLILIGTVGVIFARLIKSAVSRQREFFADASAVQFTRNPLGLAGALKCIAGRASGSRVMHSNAETVSHLFFANGLAASRMNWMSTHPPLEERIRRLESSHVSSGQVAPVSLSNKIDDTVSLLSNAERPRMRLDPQSLVDRVGILSRDRMDAASALMADLPEQLKKAAQLPDKAWAIFCALLLQPDDSAILQKQYVILKDSGSDQMESVQAVERYLRGLDPSSRLPLLQLSMGTMQVQPLAELDRWKALCLKLISADGCVNLFEFSAFRLLARVTENRLRPSSAGKVSYTSWKSILPEVSVLLAALAHQSQMPEPSYAKGVRRILPVDPPALAAISQCGLPEIMAALAKLERASPDLKRQLLMACVDTVTSDGSISVEEGEMLRAIAASLDCPIPPF